MERNRELAFERRMSDQEALMWNIEKDPRMNPSGAVLAILDRPADFDLMQTKIRYGLSRVPRLRERVVPGLGRLAPPVWATDPEFDLAYHVRHLSLPAPGSMRDLLDLVTRLYEDPYDRTRPLWMFYAIDGLESGQGALFTKHHHAVADGIGALRMAEVYTDLKRRVPRPPDVDLEKLFADAVAAERVALLDAGADMGDSILETARRTVGHNLHRQGGILRRAVGGAIEYAGDPRKAASAVGGVVEQVRSALDLVGGGRTIDASAPLWTHRSRRRHLEVLRVSLDDAKSSAKTMGGSVNDFFVTGAVLGSLAYHAERNTPVEAINMTFVVSTRTDKSMGGNSFTPVRMQVPGGKDWTIEERFYQLRDLMAQQRSKVTGRGAMSSVSGVVNLLPTSVTTRMAREQATKIDFTTSNLRGAPFQTYMAGGRVIAGIPLGPVAGAAANLTTISQNGWMDMGLLVDPAAVTDPAGLRRNIDDAYQELLEAGGITV